MRYCTQILRLFCFQKGHDMLVKYKRNRKFACYDSESLTSTGRPEPPPRLVGSFKSCGDCPYASHGFICYSREGDCLRTDMQKINQRREKLCEQ